jgi:hypothetical protein
MHTLSPFDSHHFSPAAGEVLRFMYLKLSKCSSDLSAVSFIGISCPHEDRAQVILVHSPFQGAQRPFLLVTRNRLDQCQ